MTPEQHQTLANLTRTALFHHKASPWHPTIVEADNILFERTFLAKCSLAEIVAPSTPGYNRLFCGSGVDGQRRVTPHKRAD